MVLKKMYGRKSQGGEKKGKLAKPGSPGRMAVKPARVVAIYK